MKEYGIMRLGARIFELRRGGMDICREMVSGKNRYGEKTSYAKYILIKKRAAQRCNAERQMK